MSAVAAIAHRTVLHAMRARPSAGFSLPDDAFIRWVRFANRSKISNSYEQFQNRRGAERLHLYGIGANLGAAAPAGRSARGP